ARSRDEAGAQREHVVLRDDDPCRDRSAGPGPFADDDGRGADGRGTTPVSAPRRGDRRVRRSGVLEGRGPGPLRGEPHSVSRESAGRAAPSRVRALAADQSARSRVRARGEHAFHVVKTLWGFTKVRYRGLAKNTVRAFAAFALANLYLVRYRLGARTATCLR